MHFIIYIVAFLEGFTTLSVEIVALRKFTPIIGSSSISTSIILWVILLALSYWYYKWGQISAIGKNIEKILLRNLLISSAYYFFLTFVFAEFAIQNLLFATGNYFFAILISSILLFFIPVFLASQTIPLLSELLKGNHSGEKMWKLLFYSTVWSFAGSVGTSTVFFPWIWVNKTAAIAPIFLVVCAILMMFFMKKFSHILSFISAGLLGFYVLFLFTNILNPNIIFSTWNAYHNIVIYDNQENTQRIFSMDWAYSSGVNIDDKTSFFQYIKEAEKKVEEIQPKNILVIWAAGFTFPRDISRFEFVENIDVIDVDKDLKEIAEKYFLEEKLSEKIHFYAQPARYFLNNLDENKKYDFILVDAYSWKSIPPQVLTQEFFQKLQDHWENIFLNIITDIYRETQLSQNLFTTLETVFENVYFKNTNKSLGAKMTNFIVTNKKYEDYFLNGINDAQIYTDNLNTIEKDLFSQNNFQYEK